MVKTVPALNEKGFEHSMCAAIDGYAFSGTN